jgi:hypothetical protein
MNVQWNKKITEVLAFAGNIEKTQLNWIHPSGLLTMACEFQILQAVTVPEQQLDCIVLSHSNQMMFIATRNGSVLSVQYPLQEPVQYTEHHMHNHPITRVSSTPPSTRSKPLFRGCSCSWWKSLLMECFVWQTHTVQVKWTSIWCAEHVMQMWGIIYGSKFWFENFKWRDVFTDTGLNGEQY